LNDIDESGLEYIYIEDLRSHNGHICIPAEQNTNFSVPLVYVLEVEINLLDFNPSYPKNPQTFGERIRKARMDKGLYAKELASQLGVTEDTVINWEKDRNMPTGKNMEKVREFISDLMLS
jgi:DNA-binding XRE family transcriptional regulator